ncbi:CAMK family protein kinase [Trichomonas vaginalis G3]|uniref:CAMK family protein kinase n=1 Tax=Trichomonas vaginalis (strain ATCC PRA-98 / G3) TaxID=412133 RepID=A2DWP1_TRIV3|nr:protein serine/threonine kinase protein [Trichomonas vaginalis G3]EAY15226.1 CAMK family protein kinase [Trichomonas vaginalis G3]KAI5550620.1 protein serine/threonine kinase protein [Trichomonas vaginalis G3]|eukprot:XP_001327449.1 CAMK family protein kinase [Trichomonas vaginalis G3]
MSNSPMWKQTIPTASRKMIGKYIIDKELGSGGFATVYLAYHCKTGEKVAIKVIERETAADMGILTYVENELRITSRINHPNIVHVYDIVYAQEFIYIIMEYMENGDMQNFINNKFFLTQQDQIRIAIEILGALIYLHERGISHRDIKPANIMFDKDMHARLIDFGFCREKSSNLKTVCGTQELMAPEIFLNKPYDGMKADIWAFGITIHLLAASCFPFEYKSDFQFLHDIKSNKLKIDIKPQGIIGWLVKNSLVYDPDERASAADMMSYIKSQENPATPNSLARLVIVKRINTEAAIARVRIHPNTPVIFRARVMNEHSGLRQKFEQRKSIKSFENVY